MKKTAKKNGSRVLRMNPSTSAKGHILVVEHDDFIRKTVVSMLTSAGYQCRQAAGGRKALGFLEAKERFDLIITDLVNDDLGGIGLLECTKGQFHDIPLVLITTMPRFGYALEATRNGAYDYMLKPFEREQLLATGRRALQYRCLKLENNDYQKEFGALPIPAMQKPARILAQDDEESIREIFRVMLTGRDQDCRAVGSPAEVLDIVNSGDQFDLVLCGLLESSEENLFERMTERFPDVPVIVASACGDISIFLAALRRGAYNYILKPFARDELRLCARQALEYRRLNLENRAYQAKLVGKC